MADLTKRAFPTARFDPRSKSAPPFDPPEADILPLLMQGKSCNDVAARLALAEDAVKDHIRAILRKVRVRSGIEPQQSCSAVQEGSPNPVRAVT